MNKSFAWIFVGALSLGCAAIAQASEMNGATEKAIAALEDQWVQADKASNADMLAPLLAEQFAGTNSEGKVSDRKQALADEKTSKFTSASLEDMHVTVVGTTAIARYVYKSKGTDAAGKAFDSHVRYTDTWVKMPDGKWQCVAAHGSKVKM
ncbi:MAG: nuclear transport factor 2 family protein [Steroidobacteraceae bacterium]